MAQYRSAPKTESNEHPRHPVRNFFYMLWMVLLCAAFTGIFVGLAMMMKTAVLFTAGIIVLAASALLLIIGIFAGILSPIVKADKYRSYRRGR